MDLAWQAVELLREVASVDPSVYEQQQQADAAGVRSVANFIVELSDRSLCLRGLLEPG